MSNIYKLKNLAGLLLAIFFLSNKAQAQIPACSTYVFTTSSESFAYLSGSTSAAGIHCDDCNITGIPIGFNFPFCGTNYTTVSASSNGFISLISTTNSSLTNSMATMAGIAPMLQIMWDDMWGTSGATASYLTSGTAPNRIFTFEWRNWRTFANSGTGPAISMQMRLYETSGRIQMLYKRESSAGSYNPPGATIGIAASTTDWQTLPNTGTTPVPSSTVFTTSIASWPATDQVYQWDPPTPCTKASAFVVGNVNSQSGSFSWTGVTGAMDYQYAVDTRADLSPNVGTTIVATTATSGIASGLLPNTTYYAHIRTRCSLTSISQWDTVSFRTRDECTKPAKLIIANIDSNSCTFQWPAIPTATSYQYIYSQTKLIPLGSAATTITSTSVPLTGLTEGTRYYVYYRSLCPNIDSSAWMLDSFRTPVPCRAPILGLSWLTNNNAIVYWNGMPTAYQYEYYLGTASNPPSIGTPIIATRIQTPYLQPNTDYAMYIRCNCNDFGVESKSKWAEIDFKTLPPTSINSITTASSRISVFPNPVSDKLNIQVAGTYKADAELEIADITGKTVMTTKVGNGTLQVDIRHLSSGVYTIRMHEDGSVNTVRFTKQ